MALAQIIVSEGDFSFTLLDIPHETTQFLLKLHFNSEGSIFALEYLDKSWCTCTKCNIIDLNFFMWVIHFHI